IPAPGDEHARNVMTERRGEHLQSISGVERFEIADSGFAEHEDACGLQVGVEAGQRETGLLNMGARDRALEAVAAPEQLEWKPDRFSAALEQPLDGDRPIHPSVSGDL